MAYRADAMRPSNLRRQTAMSLNVNSTHRAFSSNAISSSFKKSVLGLGLAAALLGLSAGANVAQAADGPACELDRPIKFGGMNWESNLVLVEVERFIADKGYGCKSEVLPTETLPALAALERGDLDINRSEEHTSELSHVKISYAVFCLKQKNKSPH